MTLHCNFRSSPGFCRFRGFACLLFALQLLGLTGCAVTRNIDSEVRAFAGTVAAVSGAGFRFERLPSQSASPEQSAYEDIAIAALGKVGLTPAGDDARYDVQLGVQITRYQKTPPGDLRWGGLLGGRGDLTFGMRWMSPPESWYRHAVQIVIRDRTSHQVAFETSAHFDGPWSDSGNLLPAVMDAALQGYPTPPSGPRVVVIPLPLMESR